MDNLFPIKIDIPDRKNYFYLFSKPICFLFSHENNETIDIESDNDIYYHLGEVSKDTKTFLVDYIEVRYPTENIEIKINKKPFMINIKKLNLNTGEKNFLFNQYLFNEKTKEKKKLNCFDMMNLKFIIEFIQKKKILFH